MTFDNQYGWASQLMHRLAFRSGGLQTALADIEAQMFKGQLESVSVDRPVFVTALPRAGTTILLNLLVESGHFASHTYRDMPFVLCPMLWHRLTRNFQADAEHRERAHGDGLTVAYDSPEAFEEIVWKQFWPAHYKDSLIEPWQSCDDAEFIDFFRNHIRRVVALRSEDAGHELRYVSKNNLNIARLKCLPGLLADAQIIVPFREPVQHAASLLKQHRSFLEVHSTDRFAREYMEGVGHYDFGSNLRPVNFDGWLDRDRRSEAVELRFWIEYWVAAYRSMASSVGDHVRLLSYKRLTESPEESLAWVASIAQLDDPERLVERADGLHAPRTHEIDVSGVDPRILAEARDLYAELERASGP